MLIVSVIGVSLVLIGFWGMMTRKNILRIIISFSILDTGIHIIIVSIGYIKGRTAPILDSSIPAAQRAASVVDPVPSALVLTAIVIGLAVTALMLVYAVRMFRKKGSLSIEDFKDMKW